MAQSAARVDTTPFGGCAQHHEKLSFSEIPSPEKAKTAPAHCAVPRPPLAGLTPGGSLQAEARMAPAASRRICIGESENPHRGSRRRERQIGPRPQSGGIFLAERHKPVPEQRCAGPSGNRSHCRFLRPKIKATTAKAAIMQANPTSAPVMPASVDSTQTPITGKALPRKQQIK